MIGDAGRADSVAAALAPRQPRFFARHAARRKAQAAASGKFGRLAATALNC
jgi:hypothetical protein